MAENKTYSQEDIKRYLQQQMSQQEMYAFEKALMDNPFLSDTLDGYRTADWDKAAHHLNTIEKEIRQYKSQRKIVPFISKKNNWWRVAAMIIFIVTGGMITYSILNKSANESSAVNSIAVNNTPMAAPKNDSIKSSEPALAKADPMVENDIAGNRELTAPMLTKENNAPVARLDKTEISNEYTTMAPSASEAESSKNIEQIQSDVEDAKKPTAAIAMAPKQAKEFKGQVITREGEPVPFASVKIADQNMATSTDANGNFSIKAHDSIAKVDVSSAGYASSNARIKSDGAVNKITIEPTNTTLSEVVVTGYSTKKRKAVSSSVSKVSNNKINTTPEPINGWNNYLEYLRKQVDSTLLADGKTRTNLSVEIEFSINKKGEPVRLKSKNKVDKYFSKKAMYFITNGPIWNNNNASNKAKVTVTF